MLNHTSNNDIVSPLHCPGVGNAWFAVRTQPKHEHIAAVHLKLNREIEIFHPRIRFVRSTRRGPVTVVESLFPNYLFVRFDSAQHLNLVQYSTGVSGLVHFGRHRPTVPEEVIDELKLLFGHECIRHIPTTPEIGDTVVISSGVFEGLEAVVTRVLPGSQRVAVLLHFLGRQSTVELRTTDLTVNTRQEIARRIPFNNLEQTTSANARSIEI